MNRILLECCFSLLCKMRDGVRVVRDEVGLILLVGGGRALHFLNDRRLEIVGLGLPQAEQLVKLRLLFLGDG